MSAQVPAVDELQEELDRIRGEYDDSYPDWLRFAGDATDHAEEHGIPVSFYGPNEHMPVVRYQKITAEQLVSASFEEITDDHLRALVSFGRSL